MNSKSIHIDNKKALARLKNKNNKNNKNKTNKKLEKSK